MRYIQKGYRTVNTANTPWVGIFQNMVFLVSIEECNVLHSRASIKKILQIKDSSNFTDTFRYVENDCSVV